MRFGVATGLRPLPAWKQDADFLFVQIGFDLDALLSWRAQVDVTCPVYAGVLVVPSVAMAHKLTIPGLDSAARSVGPTGTRSRRRGRGCL